MQVLYIRIVKNIGCKDVWRIQALGNLVENLGQIEQHLQFDLMFDGTGS